jgi:MoxR-like ATPase
MLTLVSDVEKELSASLVGRREEIRLLLRAAIAQENVFLYGPPGTAKSLILESFATAFGATSFVMLCNKYSTPEEVIGPSRFTKLKDDELERNLIGRMADSQFVLLDEIWKASSAIINAMLRLMNERVVENGLTPCKKRIQTVKTPMRMALSASNEFPDGDELAAAYDRFLVRHHVKYVEPKDRAALYFGPRKEVKQVSSIADLDKANVEAMKLEFTESARDSFLGIIQELADKGIVIGDRRAMKTIRIAKSEAWMHGATQVYPDHLAAITSCMWSSLDDIKTVEDVVHRHCNPHIAKLNEFVKEIGRLANRVMTRMDATDAGLCRNRCETMIREMRRMPSSDNCEIAMAQCEELFHKFSAMHLEMDYETYSRVSINIPV